MANRKTHQGHLVFRFEDGTVAKVPVSDHPPRLEDFDNSAVYYYRMEQWRRQQDGLESLAKSVEMAEKGSRGGHTPSKRRKDRDDELRDDFENLRAGDPDRQLQYLYEDLAVKHEISSRQARRILNPKPPSKK